MTDKAARPKVLVMMATYNGACFLHQQIDSILGQSGVDVTILISDDGSQDRTLEICEEYRAAGKPVAVKGNAKRLGVAKNFMSMVYSADPEQYDAFAFSDQDDVWLARKLMTALSTISQVEEDAGSRSLPCGGTPVLYCSDLQNVDVDLQNPVPELARLRLDERKRATPLLRNVYSGCTMVFNADMLRLLQRVRYDDFPRIHDAWAALLATYCGNLAVDMEHPEILRRISGQNAVGATERGADLRRASARRVFTVSSHGFRTMAERIRDDYGDLLSSDDLRMVSSFASYDRNLRARVSWALSSTYQGLSPIETLLIRMKLLLDRY